MKKITAGKPFEYSTIHSWPWVPMGGWPVWPGRLRLTVAEDGRLLGARYRQLGHGEAGRVAVTVGAGEAGRDEMAQRRRHQDHRHQRGDPEQRPERGEAAAQGQPEGYVQDADAQADEHAPVQRDDHGHHATR